MIVWKIPEQKIFLVPFPCPEKTEKWEKPTTIKITDKETKKEVECSVLDYYGVYDIDKIPTSLSQLCTQQIDMSGEMLAAFLHVRQPIFRKATRMFFFQLTKM